MRLPRSRPIPVAIPIVVLADLTLLAALFFVATTTYDADYTPVDLPVSDASAVTDLDAACVVLSLQPSPGGRELVRWRFADGKGAVEDLAAPEKLFFAASRVADKDPDRPFVVKADAGVRWATIDDALEILRNAGARDVLLWTRPSRSGGGTR